MEKLTTNSKRCPHMKVFKKETAYDSLGHPTSETVTEEFNDCYGKFCMAWEEKTKSCKLIGTQEIIFGEPPAGE